MPKAPTQDEGQGVVRDERGQEQPVDKQRAQQTSKTELPEVSLSGHQRIFVERRKEEGSP